MSRQLNSTFIEQKNLKENQPIYIYEINFQLPESNPNNWLYRAGTDFDVEFGGKTYLRFPIELEDISENTQGEIDTVTIRLANVSTFIQYYLEQYNALRGRKVIIKMIWANKLNEPNTFIQDIYYIADVTTNEYDVIFTLTSKFDLMQVELPGRKYSRYFCSAIFKSEECGYGSGANECNKTFERCRELGNQKRFNGEPSIPEKRVFLV